MEWLPVVVTRNGIATVRSLLANPELALPTLPNVLGQVEDEVEAIIEATPVVGAHFAAVTEALAHPFFESDEPPLLSVAL
jgi:hypothetical protein